MSVVDAYEDVWPGEETNIFGPLVTGADVEDWVGAVLEKWSCTYLSEVERRYGFERGRLQHVRGWIHTPSFNKWPEDQIPGILIVSTGMAERPLKTGDGLYRARWNMRLGVICSAATQAQAHKLAHYYLAAHKWILIQRPSLEGHASGLDWLGDTLPLEFDDTRTLGAMEALFTVEVGNVIQAGGGPVVPDPKEPCEEPWDPWSTVKTVDVDIVNQQIPAGIMPVTEEEE